ncbi:DUF4932 domain-containing protein [Hymenobacter sp. BT523]|uniref:DUF4932 domain-containing protein n=1 Tax=Hymenobacter sp. BT523 TaxID=2795725 RepID=UPI0018EC3331|nr:DUF4932 domain-containing protein [Hymenobacter sp. BT523]MBJ6109090.1 DUF4932 domain-containing protein [Hymenobacter sp. BT523]
MIRCPLIVLLLLCLACSNRGWAQQNRVRVETDLGVELVNALVVQISPEFLKDSAADPHLFRTTRLMRISYNYFAPFRQHAAVLRTQQLTDKLGTGVYLLPLFYDGFPRPRRHTPVSVPLLEAIHPNLDSAARLADAYMQLLGKFYQESGFKRFQQQYRGVYSLAVAQVRRNLPAPDFIPTMEAYYGAHKVAYRIIVNPFFKSQWGMAWQVAGTKGSTAVQIAAPSGEQTLEHGQVLNAGFDDAEWVRNLSVHEFGHTFVNPLTVLPAFAPGIAAQQALFRPIPQQEQYRDWPTSFNEHVVRAGEVRIALALGRPEVSAKLRADYAAWMYLPFFEAQLQRYEADRRRYPTLESFLPEIIRALPSLTR